MSNFFFQQGANGYLLEQFINTNVNNTRNDDYAGPIENRARLALEVLQAVTAEIGADRVGVRFSPFNAHYMPIGNSDPIGDYSWLLERVDKLGLAFVTLIDPSVDLFISGSARMAKQYEAAMARGVPKDKVREAVSLKPFRKCLKNTLAFTSGGYDATNWVQPIRDGDFDGIVFGRQFISNPDLVERLRNGWPLATPDKKTFYTPGPTGYIDYSRWTEEENDVKTIS
jgi:N-ethylmaleimide reductase